MYTLYEEQIVIFLCRKFGNKGVNKKKFSSSCECKVSSKVLNKVDTWGRNDGRDIFDDRNYEEGVLTPFTSSLTSHLTSITVQPSLKSLLYFS